MIETSGNLGDAGVRLHIVPGYFNYIIPMGVSGKYLPVEYSSGSNPATGYIDINPVDEAHPLVSGGDVRELRFYWNISTSGLAGSQITHRYYYANVDAVGRGNESSYIGMRYDFTKNEWQSEGSVDFINNVIEFIDSDTLDGLANQQNSVQFRLHIRLSNRETGMTVLPGTGELYHRLMPV